MIQKFYLPFLKYPMNENLREGQVRYIIIVHSNQFLVRSQFFNRQVVWLLKVGYNDLESLIKCSDIIEY